MIAYRRNLIALSIVSIFLLFSCVSIQDSNPLPANAFSVRVLSRDSLAPKYNQSGEGNPYIPPKGILTWNTEFVVLEFTVISPVVFTIDLDSVIASNKNVIVDGKAYSYEEISFFWKNKFAKSEYYPALEEILKKTYYKQNYTDYKPGENKVILVYSSKKKIVKPAVLSLTYQYGDKTETIELALEK